MNNILKVGYRVKIIRGEHAGKIGIVLHHDINQVIVSLDEENGWVWVSIKDVEKIYKNKKL